MQRGCCRTVAICWNSSAPCAFRSCATDTRTVLLIASAATSAEATAAAPVSSRDRVRVKVRCIKIVRIASHSRAAGGGSCDAQERLQGKDRGLRAVRTRPVSFDHPGRACSDSGPGHASARSIRSRHSTISVRLVQTSAYAAVSKTPVSVSPGLERMPSRVPRKCCRSLGQRVSGLGLASCDAEGGNRSHEISKELRIASRSVSGFGVFAELPNAYTRIVSRDRSTVKFYFSAAAKKMSAAASLKRRPPQQGATSMSEFSFLIRGRDRSAPWRCVPLKS
jgi:hypothetical protein